MTKQGQSANRISSRISRRSFIRWSATGIGVVASAPVIAGNAGAAAVAPTTPAVDFADTVAPHTEARSAASPGPAALHTDAAAVSPEAVDASSGPAEIRYIDDEQRYSDEELQRQLAERADSAARKRTADGIASMLQPIRVGTSLGPVRVDAIEVDRRGIAVVTLADDRDGRRWQAEICGRELGDASVRPIARTGRFTMFVRNNGTGNVPTDEGVGRAVLAMAGCIRRNERGGAAPALPSRSQVWKTMGYRSVGADG